MRKLIVILQAILLADAAVAADDQGFAEQLLASYYTEDDSVYRALLHPAMKQCANRMWNMKPGSPPNEFEYKITEATEQSIKNKQAMGRMAGLEDISLQVKPTHEIVITVPYVNEYPEGHPCHSKSKSLFTALLAQVDNEWRITTLCVSQEASDLIVRRRSEGLNAAKERSKAVSKLYANLSQEERDTIEEGLFNIKVKAIYSYSETLGVDLTTAYGVYDKACAAYPSSNDGND